MVECGMPCAVVQALGWDVSTDLHFRLRQCIDDRFGRVCQNWEAVITWQRNVDFFTTGVASVVEQATHSACHSVYGG